MGKLKWLNIILILITLFLSSCDNLGDVPLDEPDENGYWMEYAGDDDPSVYSQYDTYYFEFAEERKIYLYGNGGNSNSNYISNFDILNTDNTIVGHNTFSSGMAVETNGENKYTVGVNLYSSYQFDETETWIIKANGYDSYNAGVVCQNNFSMIRIPERELEVNSYAIANLNAVKKDILKTEYSVDPRNNIEAIFEEASIETDFPSSADQEILVTVDLPLTYNYRNELTNFALSRVSDYNYNFNDNKYIVLVGMHNYNGTSDVPAMTGITLVDEENSNAGLVMVFPDKLTDAAGDYNTTWKKRVVRTTAHELGHVRGRFLTPESQHVTYGDLQFLTDGNHSFGHLGDHATYCLMGYYLGDAYDIAVENPHFCDGHIQMLYNTSFQISE